MAHDRIMAVVSHLPHVLANVLMDHTGAFQVRGKRALHCVGSSFKDLTRVAGANPAMWSDIFLENRAALARVAPRRYRPSCRSSRTCSSKATRAPSWTPSPRRRRIARNLLEYEDITPATLYKVTVRVPDQPGVVSKVMTALGEAEINIEDLTLHHFSRSVGGDLVLFIDGTRCRGDRGDPGTRSRLPGLGLVRR